MRKIGFLCVMVLISSCTNYVGHGESRYLLSKNGDMVATPPPLTGSNISHFYDLPSPNQSVKISVSPPSVRGVSNS